MTELPGDFGLVSAKDLYYMVAGDGKEAVAHQGMEHEN